MWRWNWVSSLSLMFPYLFINSAIPLLVVFFRSIQEFSLASTPLSYPMKVQVILGANASFLMELAQPCQGHQKRSAWCSTHPDPQALSLFKVCFVLCGALTLNEFWVLFNKFIYLLFLAALGLPCCARAFSSCGERGYSFVAVCGLLIAVASLVVEHGL